MKVIDECRNTSENKLRLISHVMINFTTVIDVSDASYQTAEGTLEELARVEIFITDIKRLQKGCMI